MDFYPINYNRSDIRLFAFESNNIKCKYIQKMNELLSILIINDGVEKFKL